MRLFSSRMAAGIGCCRDSAVKSEMCDPRSDMSSNVDLSLQQFVEAWRLMCTRDARHVSASDNGLEYIFSGVPIAFFNVVVLTGRELMAAEVTSRGHAA